jgi:L-rhamnose isomerase/sugar isomerase
VQPILAAGTPAGGGAIDLIGAYRASGYRAAKAEQRPARVGGGGGIV